MILLQVMICTYGKDGISRVAKSSHPTIDGVEYIVGWQYSGEGNAIPENIASRKDFKIYKSDTIGLSKNRNFLMKKASAPLLLFSDDDVDYSEENLKCLIKSFEKYPEYDILTFRYSSENYPKNYPDSSFDLFSPQAGYYVSSIEIAIRNKGIPGSVNFDERFGVGSFFPSGEEDIFIYECLKNGFKGRYIPEYIGRHEGSTTSDREKNRSSFIQAKGAVFIKTHFWSWPLRMIAHACRYAQRNNSTISFLSYINNWMKGAFKLVFYRKYSTRK